MSDIAKTSALLAEVFPHAQVSRPDYLRWLYECSPFGPVVEANLDDERGRIGHYALAPIALTCDGSDSAAALSLNTAVHARARGRGVFVALAAQAIDRARQLHIQLILGVANANSTPGFVRHLGFDALTALPVSAMPPRPGARGGVHSGWVDEMSFAAGGLAAHIEPLLAVPAVGQARRWTPLTLRWRLTAPGARYALHRREDTLAVSCVARRHGIRFAVLLKVFAAAALSSPARDALVRAACRFHRAPIALHVGVNDVAQFRGIALPRRLRPSPLNLIHRSLERPSRPASIARFELLDFDAY